MAAYGNLKSAVASLPGIDLSTASFKSLQDCQELISASEKYEHKSRIIEICNYIEKFLRVTSQDEGFRAALEPYRLKASETLLEIKQLAAKDEISQDLMQNVEVYALFIDALELEDKVGNDSGADELLDTVGVFFARTFS